MLGVDSGLGTTGGALTVGPPGGSLTGVVSAFFLEERYQGRPYHTNILPARRAQVAEPEPTAVCCGYALAEAAELSRDRVLQGC